MKFFINSELGIIALQKHNLGFIKNITNFKSGAKFTNSGDIYYIENNLKAFL